MSYDMEARDGSSIGGYSVAC
jgi:hypothetical protein